MAHNKRTTINVPPDLVAYISVLRRRIPQASFNDVLVMLARKGALEEPLAHMNETLDSLQRFQQDVESISKADKKISQEMRRLIDLSSQILLTFRFYLSDIHEEKGRGVVDKARAEHAKLKEKAAPTRQRVATEKTS